jgi:hypothetical protein
MLNLANNIRALIHKVNIIRGLFIESLMKLILVTINCDEEISIINTMNMVILIEDDQCIGSIKIKDIIMVVNIC